MVGGCAHAAVEVNLHPGKALHLELGVARRKYLRYALGHRVRFLIQFSLIMTEDDPNTRIADWHRVEEPFVGMTEEILEGYLVVVMRVKHDRAGRVPSVIFERHAAHAGVENESIGELRVFEHIVGC